MIMNLEQRHSDCVRFLVVLKEPHPFNLAKSLTSDTSDDAMFSKLQTQGVYFI